jgi:hypothetical protein
VAIVALANATPNGAAEAVTATFTDIVRTGTTELDWLAAYGGSFKAGLFTNPSKVAPNAAHLSRAGPAACR